MSLTLVSSIITKVGACITLLHNDRVKHLCSMKKGLLPLPFHKATLFDTILDPAILFADDYPVLGCESVTRIILPGRHPL